MDCRAFSQFLFTGADGELDGTRHADAINHVRSCPACAARVTDVRKMKKTLARALAAEQAPSALRRRVENALAVEIMGTAEKGSASTDTNRSAARSTPFSGTPAISPSGKRFVSARRWLIGQRTRWFVPLSAAAIVLLALLIPLLPSPGPGDEATAAQATVANIRAQHVECVRHLGLGHHDPTLPTDHAAMAKALQEKLGFPAIAPDLSGNGLRLVGAEICDIRGRPASHVLYYNEEKKMWVSIFSVRRLNELKTDTRPAGGKRQYFVAAEVPDTVLVWHCGQQSYVACGELPDQAMMCMFDVIPEDDP